MNREEFNKLIADYKAGRLNPAEEKSLFLHYNKLLANNSLDNFQVDKALTHMEKWSIEEAFTAQLKRKPRPWPKIAAAAIILVIAGFSLYYNRPESPEVTAYQGLEKLQTIPAAATRALVILPNGDSLRIASAQDHADQLTRIYANADLSRANQYITLKTEAAGKLNFSLPDGSKVWLNAASSLTYPLAFGTDSRAVQLDGEAYFEIVKLNTKNKHIPFIVKANKQDIEVLGTKFNVSNYSNESLHKTTLAEGAVRIHLQNQPSVLLKPNQQLLQSGAKTQVLAVDASDIIAWKEGIISLSKQDFPAIARIIERNYNVTFIDKILPSGIKMNGELQTNLALNELLATLELTMNVKFLMNGRNIKIEKQH